MTTIPAFVLGSNGRYNSASLAVITDEGGPLSANDCHFTFRIGNDDVRVSAILERDEALKLADAIREQFG